MQTSNWNPKTTLLIAALALVWIGISAEAGNTPCSCEELTLSGAGIAEINGTYTYEDFIPRIPEWAGTRMWLGPECTMIVGLTLNWAVLRMTGSWIAGVVVLLDSAQGHLIFHSSDYYLNPSSSLCPPETGWVAQGGGPAPTITSTCCWYGGIGDVNNDGSTDQLDVRLIYSHVIGGTALPAGMLGRADLNNDSVVDLEDARLLAEELAGICP